MTSALLVTRDDALLDDVLRLAAAAGVAVDVAHDPESALRSWAACTVLLVGADQADLLAARSPVRRPHVHVVARATPADGLFRAAVALGAEDVVELPAAEGWLVELLADLSDGAPAAATTVGVVAGSGGAGATTLACALALTAAASLDTVLVDLDALGPGVERVVGLDEAAGVGWADLAGSHGRFGSRSLRSALPRRDRLAALGWGPGSAVPLGRPTVREVLVACQRGNQVVVLDLPRGAGDVCEEAVPRCDHVVVVAEPTLPSVASTARVTAALRPLNDRLSLVLRGDGGGVPPERVAGLLDVPLAVEMPRQRRLAEHVDLGLGPVHARRGPLARAARELLGVLISGRAVVA
ncbi:MAG: septum site-determining protein Ssd [Nocardioidaceae bacterium]